MSSPATRTPRPSVTNRFYRLSFGLPDYGRCLRGDGPSGSRMPDEAFERARQQLNALVARLTPEQKLQIDNLVISNWIPTWFYVTKGIGRPLASDERDRAALLEGLDALAGVTSDRRAAA
jgi:hypothetical protein